MTPELKQARVLLGSWVGPDVEPFCRARGRGTRINPEFGQPGAPMWLDAEGFVTVNPFVETIEAWSVECAFARVGLGFEAMELFEKVVEPPAGLLNWLRASERRTSDILAVMTKCIQRSKKEGR